MRGHTPLTGRSENIELDFDFVGSRLSSESGTYVVAGLMSIPHSRDGVASVRNPPFFAKQKDWRDGQKAVGSGY